MVVTYLITPVGHLLILRIKTDIFEGRYELRRRNNNNKEYFCKKVAFIFVCFKNIFTKKYRAILTQNIKIYIEFKTLVGGSGGH